VAFDGRARDLSLGDRRAVERSDDADLIGANLVDDEIVRVDAVGLGIRVRDDAKQRRVDAIVARGENAELTSLFSAFAQKFPRALEAVAMTYARIVSRRRRLGAR